MTKKKSQKKADQQQNFQPPKSKTAPREAVIVKNRVTQRVDKKKKQPERIPVYSQMRIQDRRAQQQKYRESFLMKKMEQQKRGFKSLKYDEEANSQMAQIDEDSVQKRYENETVRRIKDMLEADELNQNKHHLSVSAQNQYAKVQKLAQKLQQHNSEYKQKKEDIKDMVEDKYADIQDNKQKPLQQLEQKFLDLSKQIQQQVEDDNGKSIVDKINELQQIYY